MGFFKKGKQDKKQLLLANAPVGLESYKYTIITKDNIAEMTRTAYTDYQAAFAKGDTDEAKTIASRLYQAMDAMEQQLLLEKGPKNAFLLGWLRNHKPNWHRAVIEATIEPTDEKDNDSCACCNVM